MLYNVQSPLTEKSEEVHIFWYAFCFFVTRLELGEFHSQSFTLREQLNFCRKVAAGRKVLSVLLAVSSARSFFLMPKKTSLHQPVWASSEDQVDQNSAEILSEPEAALEGLGDQSGSPQTSGPLCVSHGPLASLSLCCFSWTSGLSTVHGPVVPVVMFIREMPLNL